MSCMASLAVEVRSIAICVSWSILNNTVPFSIPSGIAPNIPEHVQYFSPIPTYFFHWRRRMFVRGRCMCVYYLWDVSIRDEATTVIVFFTIVVPLLLRREIFRYSTSTSNITRIRLWTKINRKLYLLLHLYYLLLYIVGCRWDFAQSCISIEFTIITMFYHDGTVYLRGRLTLLVICDVSKIIIKWPEQTFFT